MQPMLVWYLLRDIDPNASGRLNKREALDHLRHLGWSLASAYRLISKGIGTFCHGTRGHRGTSQRKTLVAVAAGNSRPDPDTIGCSGCVDQAIPVAAVDRQGRVADFSSRGGSKFPDKPDVAAPGVNIYSGTARASLVDAGNPDAGFGYSAISGTSMATPLVAGLLALLKHRNPEMTEREFKVAVRQRGGPFNHATGWGVPRWSWFFGS